MFHTGRNFIVVAALIIGAFMFFNYTHLGQIISASVADTVGFLVGE